MSIDLIGFMGFTVFAVLFIVLPVLFKTQSKQNEDAAIQSHLNQALFAENLQQIEAQLRDREIGQKTFEKLKQELEKQLEQDQQLRAQSTVGFSPKAIKLIYVATAVVVPALAFGFYQQWGAKPDWEIYQTNIAKVRQQERGASPEQLRELNKELKRLIESRLEQRDDNLHNRFLLARTYAELEDYPSSMEAYQSILDLRPQAPDVVSEMAQVLYLSEGSQFTLAVKKLFDQAIQLSPENVRTISFAGLSAYQSGAYQAALQYWQLAVSLSDPATQQYQYMAQALEETQKRLQEAGIEPVEVVSEGSIRFQVKVALGEDIDIDPNYRVFIYARAWKGPKMPLSMREAKVSDLPLTLTLDESMAMPGIPMKLSQFPELELVARASRSGQANAQPGDWEASLGPISQDHDEEAFQLVITSQIP